MAYKGYAADSSYLRTHRDKDKVEKQGQAAHKMLELLEIREKYGAEVADEVERREIESRGLIPVSIDEHIRRRREAR